MSYPVRQFTVNDSVSGVTVADVTDRRSDVAISIKYSDIKRVAQQRHSDFMHSVKSVQESSKDVYRITRG